VSRKRLLTIVFPGATSPPRDGASAFASAVLALLARERHLTQLIVPSLVEPVAPPAQAYACASARWLPVPAPATGLFDRARRTTKALIRSNPPWVDVYAAGDVVESVRRAAAGSDVVIGFGAASSPIVASAGKPSLLLLFSLPADDVERAGGSALERLLARRFEARLPRRHALVGVVTSAERDRYNGRTAAGAAWLPFPVASRLDTSAADGRPPRLLFIADWNYPPNRTGLEFLLREVMPEVWRAYPAIELVLAGKGSTDLDIPSDLKLTRWGEYDDLGDVVDGRTLAVLPLLAAGGVRTRLFELVAAGVPVLATVEATSGDDLPGVDSVEPMSLRTRLLELLAAPNALADLRAAARLGGGEGYSERRAAELWEAALDAVAGAD
jgi:Glycosyl transferases group 1